MGWESKLSGRNLDAMHVVCASGVVAGVGSALEIAVDTRSAFGSEMLITLLAMILFPRYSFALLMTLFKNYF